MASNSMTSSGKLMEQEECADEQTHTPISEERKNRERRDEIECLKMKKKARIVREKKAEERKS